MGRAGNIDGLIWPTTYDKQKVLQVAHPIKIILPEDLRDSVENDGFC
jgi:hypothetical protein